MNGNTPLHLAAANGYTNTMTAILKIHEHLLNSVNKKLVIIDCFYDLELDYEHSS